MTINNLLFTFIWLLLNNSIWKRHSLSRSWTGWSFDRTLFLQQILNLHILIILQFISQVSKLLTLKRINRHLVLVKSRNKLFRWSLWINDSFGLLCLKLLFQLINTLSFFFLDLFLLFLESLNIWTRPIRPNYLMCE